MCIVQFQMSSQIEIDLFAVLIFSLNESVQNKYSCLEKSHYPSMLSASALWSLSVMERAL